MDRRDRRKIDKLFENNRFFEVLSMLDGKGDDYYTNYIRGLSRFRLLEFPEALRLLRLSISQNSAFEPAKIKDCECCLILGLVSDARLVFDSLEDPIEIFDRTALLTELLIAEERRTEAQGIATELVNLVNPSNLYEVEKAIIALLKLTMIDSAVNLSKVVEDISISKRLKFRFLGYYVTQGEIDNAQKILSESGLPGKSFYENFTYARYLQLIESLDCLQYAQKAYDLRPNSEEAVALLVDCLIRNAEDKKATKLSQDFLRKFPMSAEVSKLLTFLQST